VEAKRHERTNEDVEAGIDNGKKEDGKGQSEEGEGGHGEDQQSSQAHTERSNIKDM
jgi:hypothetical protein